MNTTKINEALNGLRQVINEAKNIPSNLPDKKVIKKVLGVFEKNDMGAMTMIPLIRDLVKSKVSLSDLSSMQNALKVFTEPTLKAIANNEKFFLMQDKFDKNGEFSLAHKSGYGITIIMDGTESELNDFAKKIGVKISKGQ